MAARTLSKRRFKLAVECPTKVFYSLDRRYVNAKDEDEFLQALASTRTMGRDAICHWSDS